MNPSKDEEERRRRRAAMMVRGQSAAWGALQHTKRQITQPPLVRRTPNQQAQDRPRVQRPGPKSPKAAAPTTSTTPEVSTAPAVRAPRPERQPIQFSEQLPDSPSARWFASQIRAGNAVPQDQAMKEWSASVRALGRGKTVDTQKARTLYQQAGEAWDFYHTYGAAFDEARGAGYTEGVLNELSAGVQDILRRGVSTAVQQERRDPAWYMARASARPKAAPQEDQRADILNRANFARLSEEGARMIEKDASLGIDALSEKAALEYQAQQIGVQGMLPGLDRWAASQSVSDPEVVTKGADPYRHLTEQDRAVYNYLLAAEGQEEARAYIDRVAAQYAAQEAYAQGQEISQDENGLRRFGRTVGTAVGQGVGQFNQGVQGVANAIMGRDEAMPVASSAVKGAAVREGLADAGPSVMGQSLGQVAYDLGTTATNMAPSMLVGAATGVPAIGAALLGASAGGNAYNEAIEQGYTPNQARMYGVLTGVSEAALEHVIGGINPLSKGPVKNLVKKSIANIDKAALRFAAKTGASMVSEGFEEYAQEVLDPVFRNLALDENNEFQLVTEEAAYAALLGALSAGLLNSPGNLATEAQTQRRFESSGKEVAKEENGKTNLMNLADKAEKGSAPYQIAQDIKSGKAPASEYNYGRLAEALKSYINDKAAAETAQSPAKAAESVQSETTQPQAETPTEEPVTAEGTQTKVAEPVTAETAEVKTEEPVTAEAAEVKTEEPVTAETEQPKSGKPKRNSSSSKMFDAAMQTVSSDPAMQTVLENNVEAPKKFESEPMAKARDRARAGQVITPNIVSSIQADPKALAELNEATGKKLTQASPVDEVRKVAREYFNPRRASSNLVKVRALVNAAVENTERVERRDISNSTLDRILDNRSDLEYLYEDGLDPAKLESAQTRAEMRRVLRSYFTDRVNSRISAQAGENARAKDRRVLAEKLADAELNRLSPQRADTPVEGAGNAWTDLASAVKADDAVRARRVAKDGPSVAKKLAEASRVQVKLDPAAVKADPKEAEYLDKVAKLLDTVIRMEPSSKRGGPNAQIKGREITLYSGMKKPVLTVAAHEITHRLQDLTDTTYPKFREYALTASMKLQGATRKQLIEATQRRYARFGVNLTRPQAMDEIAADFAGTLMENTDAFRRLVQDNRSMARKIYDALAHFVARVKEALGLTDLKPNQLSLKEMDHAVKLWGKMLDEGVLKIAQRAADPVAQKSVRANRTRYSLRGVPGVQPSSGAWRPGATFAEVKEKFPDLFELDSEESDSANPTQNAGTKGTYKKIYEILKAEGFSGRILDASSGFGYGTELGRDQFGFDVDDIEPYPRKSYDPKYRDYSTLEGPYDAIISNAVLNVLPQDLRDAMVVKIGELLAPGGRAFINVRGTDVATARGKEPIDESHLEYYIAPNGSYQKGFRPRELHEYLSDALGPGFTVKMASNRFGTVSAIVTKTENAGPFAAGPEGPTRDSSGRELSPGQTEFFKDSKAVDSEGRLLKLYHGTGSAGFTVFDPTRGSFGGNWFTTSKKDADSYAGNPEGRLFDPEEVTEKFESHGGEFRVGPEFRFDSAEDRAEFLRKNPNAESYKTRAELEAMMRDAEESGDWDEFDRLESRLSRREWEAPQRAYAKYEWEHSAYRTIKDLLEDPGQFSVSDVVRAMDAFDPNNDAESAVAEGATKEDLVTSLRVMLDDLDPSEAEEVLGVKFKARIPVGASGIVENPVNNRTYGVYANVLHPKIFNASGESMFGDLYEKAEEALRSEEFDGVIIRNVRVGASQGLGDVVIAKSANQVKLMSNENPTDDPDIRYSLSGGDEEYQAAVEAGNTEAAQRMVDEAARAAGFVMPGSHGTNAEFHVFDRGDIGFHFGTDEQAADRERFKGKSGSAKKWKTIHAYLNIKNPLSIAEDLGQWNAKNIADHLLIRHAEGEYEELFTGDSYQITRNGRPEEVDEVGYLEAIRKAGAWDPENSYHSQASRGLRRFLMDKGYDGIEYENHYEGASDPDIYDDFMDDVDGEDDLGYKENFDYSYIAFSPNQVKSADPVVYDDAGNVIPLSERFNPEEDDIRYSLDDDPQQSAEAALDEAEARDAENPVTAKSVGSVAQEPGPLMGWAVYASRPGESTGDWLHRLQELSEQNGTILLSKNDSRGLGVPRIVEPGTQVRQTASSVANARVTPEKVVPKIGEAIVSGRFDYAPVSNKVLMRSVEQRLKGSSLDDALLDWRSEVRSGKLNDRVVATGELLLQRAAKSDMSGEHWVDLAVEFAELASRAGHALQAAKLLKQLTPEGKLYTITRTVEKLNQERADSAKPKKPKPHKKLTTGEVVGEVAQAKSKDDIATKLAKAMARYVSEQKAKAATNSMLQSLLLEAKRYAERPEAKSLTPAQKERMELDRLRDMVKNRAQYEEVWQEAAAKAGELFANDPDTLEKLSDWMAADLALEVPLTQLLTGQSEILMNKELADRYLKAETDEARDEALDLIYQDLAQQIPATTHDKLTAWRYLAMLGNLKTILRNFVGNAIFTPARLLSNASAGLLEAMFVKSQNRTTSVRRDKATLRAAKKDFKTVESVIMQGGKYSSENLRMANGALQEIENRRRIFKSAMLEGWRTQTNKLMDKGDRNFASFTYADSLARYMAARKTTWDEASEALRDKARAHAVQEASEAVFRDSNAVSDFVSRIRIRNPQNWLQKSMYAVTEGLMPFRKTPANIAVRAAEYSPLGILRAAVQESRVLRGTGNVTGADVVASLSKAFTGSALVGLGFAFATLGYLNGKAPSDDDEKRFWEMQGHRSYSLEFTDETGKRHSLTLDWLAPLNIPLFLGANLHQAALKKGLSMEEAFDALMVLADPMLEMSFLQGLNNALDEISRSQDNGALVRGVTNALTSYVTQYIPTLAGQAERTAQDTRMTTYPDRDNGIPDSVEYTLGRASAKIPGWDYAQIEYIDAWGRTQPNGNSPTMRAISQFIAPGYLEPIRETPAEQEILRLSKSQDDTGLLFRRARNKVVIDKQEFSLSADEYLNYAVVRGQTALNLVNSVTGSPLYAQLDDENRAKAIKRAYAFAEAVAKEATFPDLYAFPKDAQAMKDALDAGIPIDQAILAKTVTADIEGVPTGKLNAEGRPVVAANSRSLKVMDWVHDYAQRVNLSEAETDQLAKLVGVSETVRGWTPKMRDRKLTALLNKYQR